jgi:hypothetical protein
MNHFYKVALAIFTFFFIVVYFLIPNEIKVSREVIVPQPSNGVIRALTLVKNWNQWIPASKIVNNTMLLERGALHVKESFLSTIPTDYIEGTDSIRVNFFAISKGANGTLIKYDATIDNRHVSPIQRIVDYWTALKLKAQMNKVLAAAGKFYSSTEKIYGFPILEDHVKDSIFVSIHHTFTDTPSVEAQYDLMHKLEQHIQKYKGVIKGAPMANITKLGAGTIFAQMAYPIATVIPESDDIEIKKMVLGNILTVKVIGNAQKIRQAFEETENYIHDWRKSSPAMPFVVYNTNRLEEKDANKWESTIYYPVY